LKISRQTDRKAGRQVSGQRASKKASRQTSELERETQREREEVPKFLRCWVEQSLTPVLLNLKKNRKWSVIAGCLQVVIHFEQNQVGRQTDRQAGR
jgi:hypothetical protein